MKYDKLKFIHDTLGEAKDFSKEVRAYLYEIEKKRPLTDTEKTLWDKTHNVHVHTDDARLLIQENNPTIF